MNTNKNRFILAILAFGFYFITGAVCALRGSELNILADLYNVTIDQVVLVGSAFAIGRVATAYLIGKLVQEFDPLKIMFAGVTAIALYIVGIVIIPSLEVSYVLAFFAGVGMGTQDSVCPLFLSYSFTKGYSSSLSAGQALYGLGGFAMSFLVGLMFTLNVNPIVANYIIVSVAILLLVLIPFAKYDHKEVINNIDEETVKPLFTKNEIIAYAVLGLECFIYCIGINAVSTYVSSFGLFKGLTEDISAYLLTAFNVGCFVGSIVFIFVLKKVKEITILIYNSIISAIAIGCIIIFENIYVYFIAFIIIGIFSGVIFSIILAIVTRIGYKKIAIASAIIGTTGGIGDIFSPIITASFIRESSLMMVFKFVFIVLLIQTLVGIIIKKITREEA